MTAHTQVEPTQFEKTVDRSAGIDEMPLADGHEQQVIIRALAVGYAIAKMVAWVIDLFWQSGLARRQLSVAGLVGEFLVLALGVGLVALPAALGHPLIPWGWAAPSPRFDDSLIWILGGLVVGTCCGWYFRRRKLRSKLREHNG